jgi:hypothetical protein
MRRIAIVVGVVFVNAILSGCGNILGSARVDPQANTGSAYSLPKAVLDVKLSDVVGDIVITVSEPVYVPDERFTYLLQYIPNAFSSDTVELTIDPKTNLLQTVSGTAEDKTTAAIVALANAAALGMIPQVAPGEEIVIFERKIDPSDDEAVKDLNREMNKVAMGHSASMFNKKCTVSRAEDKTSKATKPTKKADNAVGQGDAKSDTESKESMCASYKALSQKANITFVVRKPAPSKAGDADCSIGACYRVPAPYGIEFTFNDQYSYGTVVNLPNAQPALVVPLERSAFVKRVDNVDFENGMLKKTHFEKPSEALEVAALPVTVMTAIFQSIATLIELKFNISDKEKLAAEKKVALLDAQKALADKQAAVPQSATAGQTNVLLSGSSSGLRKLPAVGRIPVSQQPPPVGPTSTLTSPSNPGGLVSPSPAPASEKK